MAANGKVAVDKLKIGATVSIKLKDSGSCEGAVYTVDPVTKTVVLFSSAEKPVTQDSRDVRLVPEHAIDSIKVVKPPDAKDKKALVAPLPAIDQSACEKREQDAFEAMEAAMAMLNPNASAAGQACFDALSKTLDCSWSGMISASRRVEEPSLHSNASSPGMMEVGGFFFDFEAIRTASSDRDAPRR
jgi:hypothetical protein